MFAYLLPLSLLAVCAAALAADAQPIDIGHRKQLFIDSRFIADQKNVTLTMNPAQRTGEACLVADQALERGWIGSYLTVIHEGDRFRMWYEAFHWGPVGDRASAPLCKLCYAESEDGIHWTKPHLGLYDFDGSRDNNLVFHGRANWIHGCCVFVDPTAPPGERYKMIYGDRYREEGRATAGAYSSDGIHWQAYEPRFIVKRGTDTQNIAFYDTRINKYVAYQRLNNHENTEYPYDIRAVCRAEASEFTSFSKPVVVMEADERDPAYCDIYNNAITLYPYAQDAYIGFPSIFYHSDGSLVPQLAISRDGVQWSRPWREPFIELGPEGSFDCRTIYVGASLVRAGDELWLYYGAQRHPHGAKQLPKRLASVVTAETEYEGTISRAVLRLDGFVSADTPMSGGELTTPPLVFAGSRLELNMNAAGGGEVIVELLDEEGKAIEGFSADDADPLYYNNVRAVATWRGNPDVSALQGQSVRLRLTMRATKLYAFQFVQ